MLVGRELVRPFPLLVLLVMVLNDRYWKLEYHNFWTGKISDFAGLFLAPLVLTSVVGGLVSLRNRILEGSWQVPTLTKRWLLVACALTGIGYSLVNVFPVADSIYEKYLLFWMPDGYVPIRESHVRDLEDLIALPVLFGSYLWGSRFTQSID